jgi:lysozyme
VSPRWKGDLPELAVALIKAREDFRSNPYDDGYGFWTIGYGSRRTARGTAVGPSTPPVTREEAAQLLHRDMDAARADVAKRIPPGSITEQQAAPLISLAYNLGSFAQAQTLLRLIEARDWPAAARQFGEYRMSAGRVSRGLRRRRWAEAAVFLAGVDPEWAWGEALRLIETADDWPPLPLAGVGPAAAPAAPAAPAAAAPRPITVSAIGELTEADRLNDAQLAQIRRTRSHG